MQTGIILNGRILPEKYSALKADLIYLGSEFCQNLLPGPEQFGRALKIFKKPVVLATPFLTDSSFPAIEAIIREYGTRKNRLEIVANDLGLIHLVAERYASKARISLGRVLGDFLKSAPDVFLEKFLAANGINRIEADSAEVLSRYSAFKGLSFTSHVPYAHVSVTRYCPWEEHWTGEKCGYSCLGKSKELTDARLRMPLLLMNCGYFVDGGKLPRGVKPDRTVYSLPASALARSLSDTRLFK